MMIFLIIESARILWAWNTVQHAAREGARYAITGQFDGPTCPVDFGIPKFRQNPGRDVCEDDNGQQTSASLRVASIINTVHENMAGLPLNETSNIFEDDEYYNIEVWGATEGGQILYDYGGVPGNPVVVRVTYQVPIITPFFRPIRTTMPVFGQEVLNNENFGQLGNITGEALPPELPPLPTPGVTPSPTPSPTPSDTPTTATNTPTATPTETPITICEVEIEGNVVETQNFVWVTGDLDTTVQIVDLTTGGTILGFGNMDGPFDGHACDGFISISVSAADLIQGHVLAAISSDGSTDTTIVLGAPPTNTPTPSNTPIPTSTPSPTFTATPSVTPSNPYIVLNPDCGTPTTNPGNVSFNVTFINWPTNQSLTLLWEGVPELV
ncbi:MAG: TadE/TadG family type IV pilus assembly protein, partial [Saprospiraceae bacterium]|nr:TadE/TadG family type IV pilus assembly protein [Saprospiraceae bacterium]